MNINYKTTIDLDKNICSKECEIINPNRTITLFIELLSFKNEEEAKEALTSAINASIVEIKKHFGSENE